MGGGEEGEGEKGGRRGGREKEGGRERRERRGRRKGGGGREGRERKVSLSNNTLVYLTAPDECSPQMKKFNRKPTPNTMAG